MAKVMKSRHVRGCKLPLLFVLSVSFGFVSEAFDKTAVNATQGTGTWWTEGSNWSPAGVPGSTDECLIKTTKGYEVNKFGANTANTVFTGKSLQIGEVGSDPGKGLVILVDSSSTSYTLSFPNDGLVFGHASFRAWDSVPNAVINGDLTVLSTSSAPSDFSAAKANTTYTLNGNLIGGSAAVLKLAEESDTAQLHFPLTFDASRFYGTLFYAPLAKPIKSTFGSVTFAGTISATNSEFTVPNGVSATVSRMEIQGTDVKLVAGVENGITGVKSSGALTVNDLVLGDGAKVRYAQNYNPGTWKQGPDGKTTWPFLTVPVGSDLTLDRFIVEKPYSMTSGIFYPAYDLTVVTNAGSGTKTFVSRRRTYYQVEKDDAEASGATFYWYANGDDIDLFTKGSVTRVLNTPQMETGVFGNGSLCIWSEGGASHGMRIRTKDCTFGDLRLQCGDYLLAANVWNGVAEVTLRGGLMLVTNLAANASARAHFRVGGDYNRSFHVASTISGPGDAELESYAGTVRTLTFSGDNSAWTGGMFVSNVSGAANRFVVTRGEALGGPLAAFRADALELGANAIFSVTNSVVLSEPTRGVTVSGNATVDVANGATLGVGSDMVYASGVTLAKTGAGVLTLGGEASASGNAALDVREGYVKPLATNCLNGVALSFVAGTALLLEVPGSGADGVERYGIVNPVLADGATLRVKVPFSSEPDTVGGKVSVPVCTVDAASANAMKSRIVVEKPWENFVGTVSVRENGDGTVTLVAEIMRSGMCIIFR